MSYVIILNRDVHRAARHYWEPILEAQAFTAAQLPAVRRPLAWNVNYTGPIAASLSLVMLTAQSGSLFAASPPEKDCVPWIMTADGPVYACNDTISQYDDPSSGSTAQVKPNPQPVQPKPQSPVVQAATQPAPAKTVQPAVEQALPPKQPAPVADEIGSYGMSETTARAVQPEPPAKPQPVETGTPLLTVEENVLGDYETFEPEEPPVASQTIYSAGPEPVQSERPIAAEAPAPAVAIPDDIGSYASAPPAGDAAMTPTTLAPEASQPVRFVVKPQPVEPPPMASVTPEEPPMQLPPSQIITTLPPAVQPIPGPTETVSTGMIPIKIKPGVVRQDPVTPHADPMVPAVVASSPTTRITTQPVETTPPVTIQNVSAGSADGVVVSKTRPTLRAGEPIVVKVKPRSQREEVAATTIYTDGGVSTHVYKRTRSYSPNEWPKNPIAGVARGLVGVLRFIFGAR